MERVVRRSMRRGGVGGVGESGSVLNPRCMRITNTSFMTQLISKIRKYM